MVAQRLQPMDVPFAFVGGAVMCLLVDNPEVMQFRRTKDVDVIVAVATCQRAVKTSQWRANENQPL